MPNVILSPNMSLPIPVTGVDPGPDYANNVNSSLLTVDGHDHSFGSGVQIPTSGLNINTDLSMQVNNLVSVKSVRFSSQLTPLPGTSPDLGCLYEVLDDLFYNDGLGNQIRITQSGGVAGSPGSISNLTPPASAAYSVGTQTFIWQSAVNTAANMDNGSVTIRETVANANGITISSPSGLTSDYSLTLPSTLPGSVSIVTLDQSGNISTPDTYPINAASIASNAVTTPKIINGAVTLPKMAAPNMVVTASSGSFTNSSISAVLVTNLSATITTSGKPVSISFQADNSSSFSSIGQNGINTLFYIVIDGSFLTNYGFQLNSGGFHSIPPGCLNYIDPAPSPGVHTYELWNSNNSGASTNVTGVVMVVREL